VERNFKLIKGEIAECNVNSARECTVIFRHQAMLSKWDRFFTCLSSWQSGFDLGGNELNFR